MNKEIFLFVYAKDGRITILDEIANLKEGLNLIAQGYKHTATINPIVFIEYLANECEDLGDEMRALIR